MIMIEFSCVMGTKENFDEFKKIKFKYYNIKKIEVGSPLYLSLQFLKNFIEKLDDESPFIYPLILIDSGNFTFNTENVYGFGLTSKEIL